MKPSKIIMRQFKEKCPGGCLMSESQKTKLLVEAILDYLDDEYKKNNPNHRKVYGQFSQ
jgi:hypothetical protein